MMRGSNSQRDNARRARADARSRRLRRRPQSLRDDGSQLSLHARARNLRRRALARVRRVRRAKIPRDAAPTNVDAVDESRLWLAATIRSPHPGGIDALVCDHAHAEAVSTPSASTPTRARRASWRNRNIGRVRTEATASGVGGAPTSRKPSSPRPKIGVRKRVWII